LSSFFFDTSALVKMYHSERGTEFVEAIFQRPGNRLFISRLTVIEMESAFSMKLKQRTIGRDGYQEARKSFYVDLAGRIKVVSLNDIHFSLARKLILVYGALNGLRTLDALQLAVASELRREGFVDCIVSADTILQQVGGLEEITVFNPLTTAPIGTATPPPPRM
jgi:predicted nucleic acid-binding protein